MLLLRSTVIFGFAFTLVTTACSGESSSSSSGGDGPSSSPTTSEPTDPAPTGTTTSTTPPPPPPPPADAGTDAAKKDAGPPPTDVATSPECTAYCAKMKTQCNRTCIPKSDCAIPAGQCEASERAHLDCLTTKGTWYCGADGFSIVSSCKRDATLCQ